MYAIFKFSYKLYQHLNFHLWAENSKSHCQRFSRYFSFLFLFFQDCTVLGYAQSYTLTPYLNLKLSLAQEYATTNKKKKKIKM